MRYGQVICNGDEVCKECSRQIIPGKGYRVRALKHGSVVDEVDLCEKCLRLWEIAWDKFAFIIEESCLPVGGLRQFLKDMGQQLLYELRCRRRQAAN